MIDFILVLITGSQIPYSNKYVLFGTLSLKICENVRIEKKIVNSKCYEKCCNFKQ